MSYTTHAQQRMRERGISVAEIEAAVAMDLNPWRTRLKGGDRLRYFNNDVTVITNLAHDTVVTAWRGARGGW